MILDPSWGLHTSRESLSILFCVYYGLLNFIIIITIITLLLLYT